MSVGDSVFLHLFEQEHWPQSLSGDRFLETLVPHISAESNLGGLVKVGGGCVCMYVSRSICIARVCMHEHNMDTCMTMCAYLYVLPVSLHMSISLYTCVCMCMWLPPYVHLYMYLSLCIQVYLCVYVSMCKHCEYLYICMHTCLCV